MIESQDRGALGDFLRARRERLNPQALGAARLRRRTAGLRREEVAERAGIGVDWYVRLEQGRAVRPSSTTIDALARALCLDTSEHAHLRALARLPERRPFVRETAPESLSRLVKSLVEPAYVTGQRWDVILWNEAAARLLFDFGILAEAERNILLFMFADPAARRLFGPGWAEAAKRMTAQFRVSHDLWADDPAFRSLVERLAGASRDFAKWWRTHDIGRTVSGSKTLYGPDGPRRYAHAGFQANDDPALRLVLYTPL
jgi:transcriptional regulator with XRE-family HTH domain